MTLDRLPRAISSSPERLIIIYRAIDVPVVPVLLLEVRPAKEEDDGDVVEERRGGEIDASRPLQPTKLGIPTISI